MISSSRWIVFLVCLMFSLQTVFSACEIDALNASHFDLNFNIKSDGLADVSVLLEVPYSQECFNFLGVSSDSFDCPTAMLVVQDSLFQNLGFFSNEGSCKGSYADNSLKMNFFATTDMIVNQLQNNTVEVTFRQWNLVDAKQEDLLNNSLTIIVPSGTRLVSFYPLSDPYAEADFDKGIVVWDPIPGSSKKPSVRYSTESNFVFVVLIALAVIIVFGAGIIYLFFIKSGEHKIVSEIKLLKMKMSILEQDYLKGKMDETTYRRLMEQYQIQLNDLKTKYSASKGTLEKKG
ncbi:MAG: hypothetical protein WC462_02570 [archaeon]